MASEWDQLIQELVEKASSVMLIGSIDTGKTTLATLLAKKALEAGRRVAVVDADVGQSEIGPPGAISLGFPEKGFVRLSELRPRGLYFVGSTTPMGFLLECVIGTAKMVERAKRFSADFIIIDTTGLVKGYIGRRLKVMKIELVRPEYVVLLQKGQELAGLERSLIGPQIRFLQPSPEAKTKTQTIRALRRSVRFSQYFKEAHELSFSLRSLKLRGTRLLTGEPLPRETLKDLGAGLSEEILHAEIGTEGLYVVFAGSGGREKDEERLRLRVEDRPVQTCGMARMVGTLLGLLDDQGETLALGVLRSIDFLNWTARVWTPLLDPSPVTGLVFGVARWDLEGWELPPLRRNEI